MLALISPAKTLDFEQPFPSFLITQPALLAQSEQLLPYCRALSPQDLSQLMSISDKLAGLNAARFASWQATHNKENSLPAIFAFKGDVYTGFDAQSLTDESIYFAQSHLGILSGLYGLLKPLDLIQPYRLEMGTKLKNSRGENLYEFWGDKISQRIQQALDEQGDNILVNLASDEYFKAVNTAILKAKIIKPIFLDYKNGKYKVISFYAKKARGLMCRYIMQNQLTQIAQLKDFNLAGYYFVENESTETEFVFKRDLNE